MSFSSDAKKEVLQSASSKRCCLLSEMCAIFAFSGRVSSSGNKHILYITTESASLARRTYNLIKYNFDVTAKIDILKKKQSSKFYYLINVTNRHEIVKMLKLMGFIKNDISEFVNYKINEKFYENKCCLKSFIKGAFLSGASVSDPNKNYHLEFVTSHITLKESFVEIIKKTGFSPKEIIRKTNFVLYFKSSDEIADLLSYVGAYNALMEVHNTKIMKEMRNNVNRFVNCSTANMDKVIDAAMKQVANINYLKEHGHFEELSDQLKEIANLRVENMELGLKELGELMTPKLTKSGVNHRLKKIDELANKYKGRI